MRAREPHTAPQTPLLAPMEVSCLDIAAAGSQWRDTCPERACICLCSPFLIPHLSSKVQLSPSTNTWHWSRNNTQIFAAPNPCRCRMYHQHNAHSHSMHCFVRMLQALATKGNLLFSSCAHLSLPYMVCCAWPLRPPERSRPLRSCNPFMSTRWWREGTCSDNWKLR